MERSGNGGNWRSQASSPATVCDFASAGTVSLANVAGAAKVAVCRRQEELAACWDGEAGERGAIIYSVTVSCGGGLLSLETDNM